MYNNLNKFVTFEEYIPIMSGPQTQFYPQQYPPYPGAQMGYPARPEGWAPPPNYEMNQVPLNPPPPANLQYHRPYDEREVF